MTGELLDSIEQRIHPSRKVNGREKEWKISRLIRVFPREAENLVKGFVLRENQFV